MRLFFFIIISLFICFSFIETNNEDFCGFSGRIKLVKIKKSKKKQKLVPTELGDISIMSIKSEKCDVLNNSRLKLKGFVISHLGEKKLYEITKDPMHAPGLKVEPHVYILSCEIVNNQYAIIKDTLAVSDSNGYFEINFNLNQNRHIALVHRDKTRNASIYYGTWSKEE